MVRAVLLCLHVRVTCLSCGVCTPDYLPVSFDVPSDPQVIVITDGEPAGEPPNTISNVIKGAKNLCANSQYGPGAIAFQFAQVLCSPCSHIR